MVKPEFHESNSEARIQYIDLLRAVGIILMIMGHIGFGTLFDRWIHAFHMPLFFIISGYFYKSKDIRSVVISRIHTLIIPYLIFGVFHTILYFIIVGDYDLHYIYILLIENTADGGVAISGALWFLTAMFFSEILYNLIQKLNICEMYKTVIILIISILGMAFATYLPFRLPWALDAAMTSVGFIHFGHLIKGHLKRIINITFGSSLILFTIFSILALLKYVNMRTGNYGIWLLFWTNSFGLTTALWNIVKYIDEWLMKRKLIKKIIYFLKGIGSNSIVYLCLNQLAIYCITRLADSAVSFNQSEIIWLLAFKMLIFVFTMLALVMAEKIICSTKLRFLVGRK